MRNVVQERITKPTPKDIYWAAGFWEGDGTCRWGSRCSVTQKDREPLERLQKFFGGTISNNKNSPTRFGRGVYWQWAIHGARARGFLQTIYTLVSKRRQEQILVAIKHNKKGNLCVS